MIYTLTNIIIPTHNISDRTRINLQTLPIFLTLKRPLRIDTDLTLGAIVTALRTFVNVDAGNEEESEAIRTIAVRMTFQFFAYVAADGVAADFGCRVAIVGIRTLLE